VSGAVIRSARPARDYSLGELPENVAVVSWWNAALLPSLHRLISPRMACCVCVWTSPRTSDRHQSKPMLLLPRASLLLSRACDQGRVP